MATKERLQEELSMLIPTLRKMPRRVDQLIQRVESGKIILHHDVFRMNIMPVLLHICSLDLYCCWWG